MAKPTTTVHIFEVDRQKKLAPGVNPIRVDKIRIPFVRRIDDRGKAAKKAAEDKMCRSAVSMNHSESDGVVVTFAKEVK